MRYAQQYDAMVAYLDALLRAKTDAEAERVRSTGVPALSYVLTSPPQAFRDAVSSVVFLPNRKYASWYVRLPTRPWHEWRRRPPRYRSGSRSSRNASAAAAAAGAAAHAPTSVRQRVSLAPLSCE